MATGSKDWRKYSKRASQRNPKSAPAPTPKKGARTVEDILGTPGEPIDIETVLKNTNPKFSTGEIAWTHNCQRCIWAVEAQRRGYDVEAKPRTSDDEYAKAAASFPKSYLNVAVDPVTKESVKMSKVYGSWYNPPKLTEIKSDILAMNPDGARGFFRMGRALGSGHVFNWEISGGKLKIYDGQDGQKHSLSHYVKLGAVSFQWARTDNLEFTPLIEDFVKRRQE